MGLAAITLTLNANDESKVLKTREEALAHLKSNDRSDVAAALKFLRRERSVEFAELMFERLFLADLETDDGLEIAQGLMITISRMIADPPTIYTHDFPKGAKDLELWKGWYARNKGKLRIAEKGRSDNLEIVNKRNERLYQIDIARMKWYKGEVSLDENGCIPYKMPDSPKPVAPDEMPEEGGHESGAGQPLFLWLGGSLMVGAGLIVWRLIRRRRRANS